MEIDFFCFVEGRETERNWEIFKIVSNRKVWNMVRDLCRCMKISLTDLLLLCSRLPRIKKGLFQNCKNIQLFTTLTDFLFMRSKKKNAKQVDYYRFWNRAKILNRFFLYDIDKKFSKLVNSCSSGTEHIFNEFWYQLYFKSSEHGFLILCSSAFIAPSSFIFSSQLPQRKSKTTNTILSFNCHLDYYLQFLSIYLYIFYLIHYHPKMKWMVASKKNFPIWWWFYCFLLLFLFSSRSRNYTHTLCIHAE